MRQYTKRGTTVALFLHIPAEFEEAVTIAERIAEEINEGDIQIIEDDTSYYGFAEVRLTESVMYDFDDDGTMIGWS